MAVQLTGLNLQAGGRPLLVNASALFPAGNVSLIVGCSGVGKSLLLKILAGLIDRNEGAITWSGQIERETASVESTTAKAEKDSSVAVVFQNYALLDELSPSENVEIAIDHAATEYRSRSEVRERASGLLNQLGVPSDRPTSVLSGGQQQSAWRSPEQLRWKRMSFFTMSPHRVWMLQHQNEWLIWSASTQQRYQRTSIIVTP